MPNKDIEILFAEDSTDDAMLTIRALQKSGLTNKIYHVKDGAEALDFINCRGDYVSRNIEEYPKLILLDLKMPKVSGMEVLQELKSGHMKCVPVVILTSSKEDTDIKRCYELGASSYIVKPVDSENFFHAIKDMGLYWMILNQPLN
jgi:two-component system response regulator